MNPLVRVIFLCGAILCVASITPDIDTRDFPGRKFLRKPPPIELKPWRVPWTRKPVIPIAPSPPSTQKTTTVAFAPVVLYKHDCDPCMPGWGVKSLCNDTSNTDCRPCPLGMWSPQTPHYRPCLPCSKCGPRLFEDVTCSSTRDTKCDACNNPKARINGDFIKKCEWEQLGGTLSPRGFDEDDTRIDVEVLDLQSKELDHLDESPEFSSNEEDLRRILLGSKLGEHEEDITLDDPEIDVEQPQEPQPGMDEDVSKEEEQERDRVMAMRNEASKEVEQISGRLEEQKELGIDAAVETDSDDDDDVEQGPRRFLLHPIRPFPQMVPVPKLPNYGQQDDDTLRSSDPPVENNFPPSYHSYPIDSLIHAGDGQRRKAIVLLALTCAIVLSSIVFAVCYVREYCRRGGSSYNRVLVVNLSPEEREIVRHSANVLEQMERTPKKYRSGGAYTAVIDEDTEAPISVTENPLEAYLNATDERYVAREPLIENEVLSGHRRVEA